MNILQRQWARLLILAACAWLAPLPRAAAAPPLPPLNNVTQPQIVGSFPWFDLLTDDLTTSRVFYGAVFGWTFRSLGLGEAAYTVISLGKHDIGGMLVPDGPRPVAARWLPLISVADPAAAAQFTLRHGGRILVPPTEVSQRGTHAVLADAQGAVFGVLRSSTGDPPDAPVADGDFFWVDLVTSDPAKAAAFYHELFGYQVHATDPGRAAAGRLILSSAGFARAGIAPLPVSSLHPGWLPYVLVDDVAAAVARATHAGGRVALAPREDLLDGQLAIIADPRGGLLGLINWNGVQPAGR